MLAHDALRTAQIDNPLKTVNDGEELMDYLKHRGKYAQAVLSPKPGLLLLDLNMPKKDGWEVLLEVKSDPALRSIPVVILTTSKEEEEIKRTYELGANSFIVKPLTYEHLVQALKISCAYWFEIVRLPRSEKVSSHE